MIIDVHTHLSLTKRQKTYSKAAENFLANMRQNCIDRALVIADNVANSGCANLDVLLEYFGATKQIHFIGALYPFKISRESLKKVETLINQKKIVGLKIYPGHDKIYPTDKRYQVIYKFCLKNKIPVIIHTGINSNNPKSARYNDPKHILKIAKQYPALTLVIAHYFWPKIEYCYDLTIKQPNIYYDTSGLADLEVVAASGGIAKICEVLVNTAEQKPASLIFGTDYPMCDTQKHIELVASLPLTNALKENIFFRNTQALFRFCAS